MGSLTADHAAFRDTVADLRDAAGRLTGSRDRAARSVDALLGGWRGTASSTYAEGWAEWRSGADRVLEALTATATLLDAVDADLAATDTSSGDALARLSARLG